MALPILPTSGQDPWFTERNNWDISVKSEIEGRLSEISMDARYTQINTITMLAPRATGLDQSAALAAAATSAATFGLWLQLNGDHILTDYIDIPSGAKIDGRSGTLRQTGVRRPVFRITNKTGVRLFNLKAYGLATDYVNTSAVYDAAAVFCAGTTNDVIVYGCEFLGFSGSGVMIQGGTSNIHVWNNLIVGPGAAYVASNDNYGAGITLFDGVQNWSAKDNRITEWAQGIATGHNCDIFSIERNHIYNIRGQHGIYMRGINRGKVSNNRIFDAPYQGMKIQITETGPAVGAGRLIINDNVILNPGLHGILISSTVAVPISFISIEDNMIDSSLGDGVIVDGASITDVKIKGNMIRGTNFGVRVVSASRISVENNTALNVLRTAYHFSSASNFEMIGNIGRNPAQLEPTEAANRFGAYFTACTNGRIYGNVITDTSARMQFGFYVGSGVQDTLEFVNNHTTGATGHGWRGLTTAIKKMRGNTFEGSTGQYFNLPSNFQPIANATNATDVITQLNTLLAVHRAQGDIPS